MTESTTTTPITAVVEGYFAMWNEPDAARRRDLIAATWVHDARYLDPLFAADGADALDALVGGFQAQYPGCRFRPTDPTDAHHDRARWGWALVGADGSSVLASGVDFATLAPDGRLREVTGFFAATATA